MKKIVVLLAVLSFFAGNAFAVDTTILATDAQAGQTLNGEVTGEVGMTLIGKTSKGVRVGVRASETAYALDTVHMSGSKYYGTSSDSTAIYTTSPAGDINLSFAAPDTSQATFFTDAGWAAL